MAYPGVTIFLVFFGTSLLDALWGKHWLGAALWLAMGLLFLAFDVRRHRRLADV